MSKINSNIKEGKLIENVHQELEQYREIIKRILKAFDNVPFKIIVESTLGKKVIPVNKDSELVKELALLADRILKIYYESPITRKVYEQFMGKSPKRPTLRPNEISNLLEKIVEEVFSQEKYKYKYLKNIKRLRGSGYPDLLIETQELPCFLEIKATTRPNSSSPRDFYFTPLKETQNKIFTNGHHLLLGFIIKDLKNAYKIIGWKLVDLSKINVRMKPEFNADNKEIYKREAILAENIVENI